MSRPYVQIGCHWSRLKFNQYNFFSHFIYVLINSINTKEEESPSLSLPACPVWTMNNVFLNAPQTADVNAASFTFTPGLGCKLSTAVLIWANFDIVFKCLLFFLLFFCVRSCFVTFFFFVCVSVGFVMFKFIVKCLRFFHQAVSSAHWVLHHQFLTVQCICRKCYKIFNSTLKKCFQSICCRFVPFMDDCCVLSVVAAPPLSK